MCCRAGECQKHQQILPHNNNNNKKCNSFPYLVEWPLSRRARDGHITVCFAANRMLTQELLKADYNQPRQDNNNAARKNEWSNETSGHETCLVILKQIHVRQKCYISTRYKRNRTLVDYEFMLIYILRFCGVSSSCFFGSGMEKYTTVFFFVLPLAHNFPNSMIFITANY